MNERGGLRRLHVFIEGRVQGVGFRYAVESQAAGLGLAGWVRNLVDGRVEAVYEGDPARVSRMLTWSWSGPPAAKVTNIETTEEAPLGERGFRIRS